MNLMTHFVQQASTPVKQYHHGTTASILSLFMDTDAKLGSAEVADLTNTTGGSAAAILRELWIAGQLGRELTKASNGAKAFKYYRIEPKAKCQYCGKLLEGTKKKYCGPKCNRAAQYLRNGK